MVYLAKDTLVSIIIPTYNRSWGLSSAVRSALAQSHKQCELIVVDDQSHDDTPDVIASFSDKRVRYFRQPENVGMVKNWGYGLHLAKGDFVVFLSDDDQLTPEFVENRLRRLREKQNAVVAFSMFTVHDRNGTVLHVHNQQYREEETLDSLGLLESALSRRWFVGASMYRRDTVLKVWDKVMNDDLVLDFALNIEICLSRLGNGVYLPHNDFLMMVHPEQNSQAKRIQVFEQTETLLQRLLQADLPEQYAQPIRQELACWHVVWGRSLAAQGTVRAAKGHFFTAVKIQPRQLWAWKQLVLAWLWPNRLMGGAAKQGNRA